MSEVGNHYAALLQDTKLKALSEVEGALQRGRKSPEAWRDSVQTLAPRLLELQVKGATYADAYLNDVLEAQYANPVAETRVNPAAFADLTDGGGSWLQLLVFGPNSVRMPGVDWWTRFAFVANSIVVTGLNDVARGATQAAMQTRPAVTGYIRMLRGKSCARCAILAGRRYKSAVPFARHKRCDCVHVPAASDESDGWATDPRTYFNHLSREDQDKLFTKAGAEAIRLGADLSQVVNARKGISVARAYGQTVLRTLEGTTKRGIAGQRLGQESFSKASGLTSSRFAHSRTPRLLPEEIFLQAETLGWDRVEVLRQLRRFAYVL